MQSLETIKFQMKHPFNALQNSMTPPTSKPEPKWLCCFIMICFEVLLSLLLQSLQYGRKSRGASFSYQDYLPTALVAVWGETQFISWRPVKRIRTEYPKSHTWMSFAMYQGDFKWWGFSVNHEVQVIRLASASLALPQCTPVIIQTQQVGVQ